MIMGNDGSYDGYGGDKFYCLSQLMTQSDLDLFGQNKKKGREELSLSLQLKAIKPPFLQELLLLFLQANSSLLSAL